MAKRATVNYDELLIDGDDDLFLKAASKKVKTEEKTGVDVKSDAKTEVKAELKVEPEVKPEPVVEAKGDVKSHVEPVIKPVVNADSKREALGEVNAVVKEPEVVKADKQIIKPVVNSESEPKAVLVTNQDNKFEPLEDQKQERGSDELDLAPLITKSNLVGAQNNLKDIQALIIQGLTTNDSTKAVNIYMSEQTSLRMEKIQKALKANSNVGTKAKLPLIQKILVDFFWEHFGSDVLKRVEKAEKDLAKRLL